MANQNNHGRTIWDLISDHPKITLVIIIGLIVLIFANNYSFTSSLFSIQPEKSESIEKVSTNDTASQNKSEVLKTSLPKNVTVKQYYPNPTKEKATTNLSPKDSLIKQPTVNVSSTNQSGGITANQVNIGAIPRNLDVNLKNQLLVNLKDKNEHIDIASVMGDSEAFRLANQINDFLKAQGYLNVEGVSQAMYSKPMIGQFLDRDANGIKIVIGSKPE